MLYSKILILSQSFHFLNCVSFLSLCYHWAHKHTGTVGLMWSLQSGLLHWSTVRLSLMTASTSKRGERAKPQSLCRTSRASERLSSKQARSGPKVNSFVCSLKAVGFKHPKQTGTWRTQVKLLLFPPISERSRCVNDFKKDVEHLWDMKQEPLI